MKNSDLKKKIFSGLAVAVGMSAILFFGMADLMAQEDPAAVAQPLIAPPAVDANAKSAKPDYAVERGGCVTAGCHVDIKDFQVLHGPVNVDACDACHELTSAEQHTFRQLREDETLCTFCHALEDRAQKFMHDPVTEGNCIACHNPHGGFDVHSLRGESVDSLCQQCHDDVVGNATEVHGPVASGACAGCHAAHSSPYEHLLLAEGRDMCLSCHISTEQQISEMRVVHGPVNVDCLACHDAHASNHKMMLLDDTKPLCLSCHDTVADAIAQAPRQHSPVVDENSCTNCHEPHASDIDGILKASSEEICYTCHDKKIDMGGNRILSDIKSIVTNSKFKHGPVVDHDCSACHEVHGGKYFSLLIDEYPAEFYAPYDEKNYELCFNCHDGQLVREEKTTTLTNFRNGDENLHFVHVHKSKKGRTCRACHETHASNNDLHVRDAVPFGRGGWSLPIGYARTGEGGSCTPGCHVPYEYNRVSPVSYEPPEKKQETKPEANEPEDVNTDESEKPQPDSAEPVEENQQQAKDGEGGNQ